MNKNRTRAGSTTQLAALCAAIITAAVSTLHGQDHGHLYISAYSKEPGTQLYFDNGGIFESSSGYVKTLNLNSNAGSRYVGRYDGNITVTPRSTNLLRGADYGPNAAAPGSVIHFQIVHVDGPAGGAFEFWESTGSAPAVSIASGAGATNLVKVTEAAGAPGDDPYGHIHGRRFTATLPGIYKVALRALDLSTNGLAGGSIHTVSEPITIAFQAGFALASVNQAGSVATVRFGTAVTHDFTLQVSTNLASNAWVNIGLRRRGTDHFQTVQDTVATNGARFYRVVAEPFEP